MLRAFLVVGITFAAAKSVSAQAPQDEVVYIDTDGIGSVRLVTDTSGNVVERHDLQPFGQETPSASGSNPLFAGKERDASGADYSGARYFAAKLGRFFAVDPLPGSPSRPQSWNRYTYALNSPLLFIDPDGQENVIVDADRDPCALAMNGADGTLGDYYRLVQDECIELQNMLAFFTQYQHPPKTPGGTTNVPSGGGGGGGGVTVPAPVDDNGKLEPPPVYLPPGRDGLPNRWVQGKGTKDRPVRWDPKDPLVTPTGAQPNASWDPEQGHWDVNWGVRGAPGKTRFTPDGNVVDHYNNPAAPNWPSTWMVGAGVVVVGGLIMISGGSGALVLLALGF